MSLWGSIIFCFLKVLGFLSVLIKICAVFLFIEYMGCVIVVIEGLYNFDIMILLKFVIENLLGILSSRVLAVFIVLIVIKFEE